MATYHILNGDSLLDYLTEHHVVDGTMIVLRECFVDGPVQASTLQNLYTLREDFLKTSYGDIDLDYEKSTLSEFKKINAIPPASEVNLWFEKDLFCQVNLWFACYLLSIIDLNETKIYLVLPSENHPYSFTSMSTDTMKDSFEERVALTTDDLHLLANFWLEYAKGNYHLLHTLATQVVEQFPFLLKATEANIVLNDPDNHSNSPTNTLSTLLELHGSENFGLIFQEFSHTYPELGLGDLQVMRMLKELKK